MTAPAASDFRLARLEDAARTSALIEAAFTPWIEVLGRRPEPMDAPLAPRLIEGAVSVADDREAPGVLAAAVIAWPRSSILDPDVKARGPHLYVWAIAVAPARQGAGYEAAALAASEERARRIGLPAVDLEADGVRIEPAAALAALGYSEFERRRSASGFERVLLRKTL